MQMEVIFYRPVDSIGAKVGFLLDAGIVRYTSGSKYLRRSSSFCRNVSSPCRSVSSFLGGASSFRGGASSFPRCASSFLGCVAGWWVGSSCCCSDFLL